MGTRETYQHTLLRACMIAGDETKLARRMNLPVEKLVHWLVGERAVPTEVFLRASDIIIHGNQEHLADADLFLAEVRKRNKLW